MKTRIAFLFIAMCLFGTGFVFAQNTLDDVHLFQNFLRDATITKTMYGEGGIEYDDYEYGSIMTIGVEGGYPVKPELEVNARFGYINVSPEEGDGESGLSDLTVSGRYMLSPNKTKLAAGGYVTLPIGEEKIQQQKLNFGAFGALRHPLDNGMVITGTVGLDFLEKTTTQFNETTFEFEEETEYDNSFVLAGGAIYPYSDQINIVGELMMKTEVDYMMLSAAVDYKLQMGSKVRAMLGIGLDDGAPDLAIMATFLHAF